MFCMVGNLVQNLGVKFEHMDLDLFADPDQLDYCGSLGNWFLGDLDPDSKPYVWQHLFRFSEVPTIVADQ